MRISIRDLARVALPRAWEPKVLALLSGYFDETFRPKLTVIAGFVGTDEQWCAVEDEWNKVLSSFGARYFHGSELWAQRDEFADWKWPKCVAFAERCSEVLLGARLGLISAIFHGEWSDVLAKAPQLGARFPDAYSFAFAVAAAQINRATQHWHNGSSGVGCVFEKNNQYGSRAHALWTAQKAEWPLIVSMTHASSEQFKVLECADLLANETGRKIQRGNPETLPLHNSLFKSSTPLFAGGKQTTQTLLDAFRRDATLAEILSPPAITVASPAPDEHDALVAKYAQLDR